ncbi:MAG: nitroreductase family protein [Flavobacteriales bacterium]|jgi:nitroreductase|tara:strand:- start:174 stop:902 length:729 start_codon:yes stop_codon:yes gene_type:complete
MEKTVSEAISYRRSVRLYKNQKIDEIKVSECIKNASIAPNSSNLQLWEFYHVTTYQKLTDLSAACFNQSAAKTAQQMVVFVSRKDLWKKRAHANITHLNKGFDRSNLNERLLNRQKQVNAYYSKIIPGIYTEFLGLFGLIKYIVCNAIGLFKPMYRQTRLSDMRIVAHKSTALAAQNFMISMAAVGYDTCPMEGFDSKKVKNILGLPSSAEITMVISCGVREESGVYGTQFRVPFEEVYFKI